HKEASTTSGLSQLKPIGPDAQTTRASEDLRNQPPGAYVIKKFDTQAGVPKLAGVIPADSTITATLWVRKTATAGTMYPRAQINVNSPTGPSLCVATGDTPLTTTLSKYVIACRTTTNVPMVATDRFYLWVGVNVTLAAATSVKAEVDFEGTLNGNYDSQVL